MGLVESVLASVLGGGVTGILGVIVQRYADHKNKQLDLELNRQKMAHEEKLRALDADLMAREWASRIEVARVEADGRETVADSHAFAESYNLEPKRYSDSARATSKGQVWALLVLDFIRGIVRPGLTIYLCILTTIIYWRAHELMGGLMTPAEAGVLLSQIVNTILYLSTTTLLWWFGVRNRGALHERPKK